MAAELRDLIAETLAGHRSELMSTGTWRCSCKAWSGPRGPVPRGIVKTEYERHVADVILAALGDRVLPEGGQRLDQHRHTHDFADGAACPDSRCMGPGKPITRTVKTWPDGMTLTGPWRPVDTEETPKPSGWPGEEADEADAVEHFAAGYVGAMADQIRSLTQPSTEEGPGG